MTVRTGIGLSLLLALGLRAGAAIGGPKQEVTDHGFRGSGGGEPVCFEYWQIDPDGEVIPDGPVETTTMRNGQGKIFLKKPCGWRP